MKRLTLLLMGMLFCIPTMIAQVSTHQYRRVEPENMQEYLKRETTYWQKLAESEVTKGNLIFWGIFQKVGGLDQHKAPNILIINTFKDLDAANQIWGNIEKIFPDTKMEDMETWSISKNIATLYSYGLNHVDAPNVNPETDFKYVYIIYHNVKNTGKHLDFEENEFKPLLEKAMAEGKTTVKGWGNARLIGPESSKFPYTTMSYDLFASLNDALGPGFIDGFTFPDNFGSNMAENRAGTWNKNLYRIISVVDAPNEE